MSFIKGIICCVAIIGISIPVFVNASEKTKDLTFKEALFHDLSWGMDINTFKKVYPHSENLVKTMAMNSSKEYLQELGFIIYGHISNAGFQFSNQGLENIIISYLFQTKERRLDQKDILTISKTIKKSLFKSYGKPIYSIPWDGQIFNHIWIGKKTLVQFAWDGGDSWGIQFRSVKLDPAVKQLKGRLNSQ